MSGRSMPRKTQKGPEDSQSKFEELSIRSQMIYTILRPPLYPKVFADWSREVQRGPDKAREAHKESQSRFNELSIRVQVI